MTDNSTVAQLKHDIDSGQTGDKVSAPDPGLSPLGTDDEAAGRPASPKVIDMARRQEAAIGRAAGDHEPSTASKYGPVAIMVGIVVLIGAVAVAFVLMR